MPRATLKQFHTLELASELSKRLNVSLYGYMEGGKIPLNLLRALRNAVIAEIDRRHVQAVTGLDLNDVFGRKDASKNRR